MGNGGGTVGRGRCAAHPATETRSDRNVQGDVYVVGGGHWVEDSGAMRYQCAACTSQAREIAEGRRVVADPRGRGDYSGHATATA